MPTKAQYIITAILMHILAVVYIYIIDLRIVQVGEMKWDSELGHTLLIPFFGLIGYAWVLIGLCIFVDSTYLTEKHGMPQVFENDADWKAKAVHFTDKHPNTYY